VRLPTGRPFRFLDCPGFQGVRFCRLAINTHCSLTEFFQIAAA
jgi:hypothetical protein